MKSFLTLLCTLLLVNAPLMGEAEKKPNAEKPALSKCGCPLKEGKSCECKHPDKESCTCKKKSADAGSPKDAD